MQVAAGGAKRAVAEKALDDPKVGAVFQEMSGEAVAKHMRGDPLGDSGGLSGGSDWS
jgi:hypothetical protein